MNSNPQLPRPHQPSFSQAIRVREEIEKFEQQFPSLANGDPFPTFTWEQLARHLKNLAPTPKQAEVVENLLVRTKAFASIKPAEMVLREVLCIAAIVLDEEPSRPAPPLNGKSVHRTRPNGNKSAPARDFSGSEVRRGSR